MNIERATEIDDAIVDAFARLIPQLSATSRAPTRDELVAMVAAPGSVLLVAREGGAIAGAAVLTLYRIPTGMRARLDDVVVDGASRGRGIGEALTVRAIELARAAGAGSVNLTSHPEREAANRLYLRLGFDRIYTNVYRLRLS